MRVGDGEKVVNYFGTQVIVPAWVNWLAVDKCEELYAYENEPYVDNLMIATVGMRILVNPSLLASFLSKKVVG